MEAEFHPGLMNMAASLRSIPAPNTCEADRGLADLARRRLNRQADTNGQSTGCYQVPHHDSESRTSTGPSDSCTREKELHKCLTAPSERRIRGSSAVLRRPRFGQTGSPDPRVSILPEIRMQELTPDGTPWIRLPVCPNRGLRSTVKIPRILLSDGAVRHLCNSFSLVA